MKILDRYIVQAVVAGALVAIVIVVSLNVLFEFINESGDAGGAYTIWHAFLYVLLTTPYRLYEAFPVATLLGSLMALGGLAGRSELVAMRAAGVSVFAIARAVCIAGVLLALVAAAVGEWVAPRAQRLAERVQAVGSDQPVAGTLGSGFWFRDGDRYVRVGRAPERNTIEGVEVYRVEGRELRSVITAPVGHYRGGAWELDSATLTRLAADGSVTTEKEGQLELKADLKPEMLDVIVVEPETLPLTDLLDYIRYLDRNGLQSERYRLAFWIKVATPLATITMLLLTVPLAFGSLRSTGAGQRVFVGVLIGLTFFLLNRLLNRAGLVFGLPPVVSALTPTLAFLALALAGISRVR
ncbi:MAG: LPS export ABC transporter permease LptG [Ectothiorhodospiraceae bacterium]